MIDDVIFAIKFVHVLAVAMLFGGWLAIALLMMFAHRSRNTSVVALVSRFVIRLEWSVLPAAVVLLPLSGFPLAAAIGLSPGDEFWIVLSVAIYAAVVAAWIGAVFVEWRIRNLTRDAAINGQPLPDRYYRLFRIWSLLAVPILIGIIVIIAVMIFQPRLDMSGGFPDQPVARMERSEIRGGA